VIPDAEKPAETPWQGKFLAIRQQGRWEYAERVGKVSGVVILAIDEEDHVLLIDQYRVPIDRRCLELPAGLVGDESEGETPEAAGARELEEETGYRAEQVENLGVFCSSPGMVSECFTLLRASGLTRVGEGGGVSDEDIAVRRVPLARIEDEVAEARAQGLAIDVKLLLLLGAGMLAGATRA